MLKHFAQLQNIFSISMKEKNRIFIKFLGIKINIKIKNFDYKQENIILNQSNLNKNYNTNSKKNILIVINNLTVNGGIETRLKQYLSLLKSQNYEIFILCEQNQNSDLLVYNNFCLKFEASNIENCILELIKKYNIKIAEFNFGASKYLKYLNINNLKKYVRTGCIIHNKGLKQLKLISNFDYRIIISSRMLKIKSYKKLKNMTVIANAINYIEPVWKFQNQNKALIISRIEKDKLRTICSAIEYCKKNNIDFDIAGNKEISYINKLKRKYNISDNVFIGKIDTIEFLKENWEKYLFIGGVGQVIIEAGILGYPCFCSSSINYKESSFITSDNIISESWNFTISRRNFIKKIPYLDLNNIEKYNLNSYLKEHRNLDKMFEKYTELISG